MLPYLNISKVATKGGEEMASTFYKELMDDLTRIGREYSSLTSDYQRTKDHNLFSKTRQQVIELMIKADKLTDARERIEVAAGASALNNAIDDLLRR